MKYLKVGLFIAVVSVALAGSLVAISDQVAKSEHQAAAAANGGGGCGGGCGGEEGAGGCMGEAMMGKMKPAKAENAPACAKAAKGEKCDPKTCADCAEAAKTEGKAGGGCPMHAAADKSATPAAEAKGACPMGATADKSGKPTVEAKGTCPMHAAADKSGKPAPAKAHDCEGKDCTSCEADCPHHKTVAARKAVAAKPVAAKPTDH